jgi:GNAT superfamily N-acetyltransferase
MLDPFSLEVPLNDGGVITMRWHKDGFTIDTARGRIDMPTVIAWLRTTYWAEQRSPAAIELSWRMSPVVLGLYRGAEMVGCARVVTDFTVVAYLADVFVRPDSRGLGLGAWLVETALGHPRLQHLLWLLHTRDAHALYRRFGFEDVTSTLMHRPRQG